MARLVLDDGENKLVQLLPDEPTASLDVGDIHFYKNDILVLVIERKTVDDLSASIKDGRWKEQKVRLFSFCPNRSQILYLIEGDLHAAKKGRLPFKTLQSSLCKCVIRDGIQVYKTANITETKNFILAIKSTIEKENCFQLGQVVKTDYVDAVVKVKKKDNITKANCLILQLACIPGVSTYMAKAIAKDFPDIKSLLSEIGCNEHTLLADILYSSEAGKERRIGDKVAQRIVEYMA